jgi:hypothetical protein
MSKHQGKGVKHAMKGFLSVVRKMVHPREDDTLFAWSYSRGEQTESAAETLRGRGPQSVETSSAKGMPFHIYVNFITN